MKTILTVFALLCSSSAYSQEVDCGKPNPHTIYCKMLKLKPRLNKTWAMEFSNKLVRGAASNGTKPEISLAIMMQESSLENVNTFKLDEHVEKKCTETSCTKVVTQVNQVVDMSIAQINIKTAVYYSCNIEKLFFFDEDEALACHFKILKSKMKLCAHLQDESYSCYHSINEPYRSTYVGLVKRYL